MHTRKKDTLVVTQVKSAIGEPRKIKDTLRALGIQHHQQSVEKKDDPAIRGMIAKVSHLVSVEEA